MALKKDAKSSYMDLNKSPTADVTAILNIDVNFGVRYFWAVCYRQRSLYLVYISLYLVNET